MTRNTRPNRNRRPRARSLAARFESFLADAGIIGHSVYRARVPWRV
jgi:hypothetical protein